jgi:hypothetical protein
MEELYLYPSTVLALQDAIFQKFLRLVNHHSPVQLLNKSGENWGMLTNLEPKNQRGRLDMHRVVNG